jgi:hypothetical protein
MLTSLQVEFVLHPDTQLLHVPRPPAAALPAPQGPDSASSERHEVGL